MIALRLVIRGRVQGVGYRYAMVDAAQELGIDGWVRNLADGTVEAFVQGERHAIDGILAWCRQGPPSAHVSAVDQRAVDADPSIKGFEQRHSERWRV